MRARIGGLLAMCALAACFESGPLGVGQGADAGQPETRVDVVERPDLPVLDQTAAEIDAPVVTPDGEDGDGQPEDSQPEIDSEVVEGTPCTFDGQCAGGPVDLCRAPSRCIGFVCQPDPAWVFPCSESTDPCVAIDCVPATGACVSRKTCDCEVSAQPLACNVARSFSTADPGATAVVSGYACDGEVAESGEHAFAFTADTSGGVKVSVEDGVVGGVYVLDGVAGCDAAACVAGGMPPFAFAAEQGRSYAVVVEHAAGASSAVKLRLGCGFDGEFDCGDGLDDDQNGLTDCADPLCASVGECQGVLVETQCEDKLDSDGDGATDCEDSDCADALACIQTCAFTPPAVSCGFTQGATTNSGASTATDYPCGPSSPGPEIAYRFKPQAAGLVTVTLSSGSAGARLYVLRDQGFGCAPLTCEAMDEAEAADPASVKFVAAAGQTWYLVVDGAVAGQGVQYSLSVACEP
ncbi:MAG: hypothetical protein R3F39_04750 [Myxococcota bacterium]